MDKKRLGLFIATNVILIALISLLLGLLFKDHFAFATWTTCYIMLLVTLCLPTVLIFLRGKCGLAGYVVIALLFVSEVVISIIGLCNYTADVKLYAILHGAIYGTALLITLGIIALTPAKAE